MASYSSNGKLRPLNIVTAFPKNKLIRMMSIVNDTLATPFILTHITIDCGF